MHVHTAIFLETIRWSWALIKYSLYMRIKTASKTLDSTGDSVM